MKLRPVRLLLFSLVVLLCACLPAETTTDPCADAGVAAPTTLVSGRAMKNLAVTADALVYVDTEGRGTLRRASLDGSNDTALYASPMGKRLFDSLVVGDTVWLFEQESGLTGIITRVLKVPLAGGAPASLVLAGAPVFFLRHEVSPERFFVRVANSGSEAGELFAMATDGTLTRFLGPKNLDLAQVTDDGIFFMYRPSIGDDASSRALHRAAKEANATDAQVGEVHCRGDFYRLAGGNLLCAGYSSTGTGSPRSAHITQLDANGGNPRTLVDFSDVKGRAFSSASVAAEVGDEVLLSFSGSSDTVPLLAVKTSTGAARAIACNVTSPRFDTGSGRAEVVVVGDSVYWIAQGARGVPPETIFKASLR